LDWNYWNAVSESSWQFHSESLHHIVSLTLYRAPRTLSRVLFVPKSGGSISCHLLLLLAIASKMWFDWLAPFDFPLFKSVYLSPFKLPNCKQSAYLSPGFNLSFVVSGNAIHCISLFQGSIRCLPYWGSKPSLFQGSHSLTVVLFHVHSICILHCSVSPQISFYRFHSILSSKRMVLPHHHWVAGLCLFGIRMLSVVFLRFSHFSLPQPSFERRVPVQSSSLFNGRVSHSYLAYSCLMGICHLRALGPLYLFVVLATFSFPISYSHSHSHILLIFHQYIHCGILPERISIIPYFHSVFRLYLSYAPHWECDDVIMCISDCTAPAR